MHPAFFPYYPFQKMGSPENDYNTLKTCVIYPLNFTEIFPLNFTEILGILDRLHKCNIFIKEESYPYLIHDKA